MLQVGSTGLKMSVDGFSCAINCGAAIGTWLYKILPYFIIIGVITFYIWIAYIYFLMMKAIPDFVDWLVNGPKSDGQAIKKGQNEG